ncbi:MAG: ATP-dependent RNA helicase HrpA [Spirochaetes bacterium]|nr:ATP-dependent RNA helicase HrpA [Spirochaetota bacterium]
MNKVKLLEKKLNRVMSPDRYSLKRELKNFLRKTGKKEYGSEENDKLNKIEKKINASIRKKEWRKKNIPELSFNNGLPITEKKDEIIEAIRNNNILIISGETGSGKTTQIPKFCLAAGRGVNGVIGCTQPRRIAAISVADRIAQELGESAGNSVGYKIRFDDKSGKNPFIKIMTDGILLAETQNDPYLNYYDTIIVDEAHERSINIDFILGILKNLTSRRRDLKLIITSATIDTEKFSRAFNSAPVIEVSGKMYPVEVRYQGIMSEERDKDFADYTERAAETAVSLLNEGTGGDILIFMPTEQDIRETCELLEKRNKNHFTVFPLFSRLPAAMQKQIFNPISKRKIIVSTNIAETSLTIPDIRYVIDTGLARISHYSSSGGTVSMPVKAVSKSSADQRRGRSGRVREGVCVRLYDEEDYDNRDQFTLPEIFRISLAEVILKMISLKLGDVSAFPFIDKPRQQAINDGYSTLIELGAIREDERNKYSLTAKGKVMANLPIDPRLSGILVESNERKCMREVLPIVAMLSVQDPKERPFEKEREADGKHAQFINQSSDFLTLLNIWNAVQEINNTKSRNKLRKFCRENFLSYNRIKDAIEIHSQLSQMLEENNFIVKKGKARSGILKESGALYVSIHKSILTGFLSNVANKKTDNIYAATRQREVMIFPGSGLFNKAKDWIMCVEFVFTSRLFGRTAAGIRPDWIEELGGRLCEYSYRDPYWNREMGDVYAYEQVSLYGLILVSNRRIAYGRVNPEASASVFIREALVEDMITQLGIESTDYAGRATDLFQLGHEFSFIQHNIELLKKFKEMENRLRTKIIVSREELCSFYSSRIKSEYNVNTLRALIKKNKGDDFLRLKEEDLLSSVPDYEKLKDYPVSVILNDVTLELVYKFDPGSSNDGVTVVIPVSRLQSVNMYLIESRIPGLYRGKITELIKKLPRQYRKLLVPVTETVQIIINEMHNDQPLLRSIAAFIHDKYKIHIPEDVWREVVIDEHFKLKISVIDHNGKQIKSGTDPEMILKDLTDRFDGDVFSEIKKTWERENIEEWDFGDLAESIQGRNKNGLAFTYYPGLAFENGNIALRIFRDRRRAEVSHKKAVSKLLADKLSAGFSRIKNMFVISDEYKSIVMLLGGSEYLLRSFEERIVQNFFYKDIRSAEEFEAAADKITKSIAEYCGIASQLVNQVFRNYRQARDKFKILKSQNKSIRPIMNFLKSIEEELNLLVPRDFLLVYNNDELACLENFITALSIRAERGCTNLAKDAQKENEVLFFKEALEHENSVLSGNASAKKRQALRDFFWLLEEYKVSVFAPEIKPRFKVSGKRLQQALEEIRGIN